MIPRNTLRTLAGFIGTLFSKYLRLNLRGEQLEDVFNYVEITDDISTSGQPTPKQFKTISDAGYEMVINLLPRDTENSLRDEAEIIAALEMEYVHIPVNFKGPKQSDFQSFSEVMQANRGRKVWIHCAVNARVSVFVAKYRMETLGEDGRVARAPIGRIWEPYGVWSSFLNKNNSD